MPTQFDLMKLRQQQQFGPSNPYFNPVQESGVAPPNPYFSPPPSSDIGGYEDFSSPQRDYGHIDPFMIDTSNSRSYGEQIPNPSVPKYGPDEGDPRNPNRIWDMINKIYTPETRSRDRVNTLLDNVPERQDPSFARRLVAAGMGFGQKDPLQTMDKVMYSPHNNAMADWTAKTGPFQQAYTAENASNINERTLASSAVTAQAAADRQASTERIADQKNETNLIRNRAYAWKQMHPDWEWDTKGPTYVLKGPGGEVVNTGIKTGSLGDEDLQLLKNKGALAAAEAGAGSREKVAAFNGPVLQDKDGNIWEKQIDGNWKQVNLPGKAADSGPLTKPGTTTTEKLPTESQARAQEQTKYKQILIAHPEYRDLFKSTGTGTYTLRPKQEYGTFWTTDKEKENMRLYDEMVKEYFPDKKGLGPSATPTAAQQTRAEGPPAGFKGSVPPVADTGTDAVTAQAEIENARKKAAGTDGNNTQTLPTGGQTDSHGYRYQRNAKTGEWRKSLDGVNWIPAGAH